MMILGTDRDEMANVQLVSVDVASARTKSIRGIYVVHLFSQLAYCHRQQ